jgi:hypothetical protein
MGNGASTYESFADCSGFINALIKQTYGCDEKYFKSWMGKTRPLAYHYYDAIAAENQFTIIRNINDIQPGDLTAIKYNDRPEHDDNTGHLLLVAKRPQHRNATALVEPGMDQYEITVIDASKSPHGKSDSRHTPDGTAYAGLGKGLFRLYAGEKGVITGYSWSVERPKIDFDPFSNPVIVGRIKE